MAGRTTHSYFLNAFVDDIVRTNGAALAGTIPPPTRESVLEELSGVALRAAQRLFGMATPIEVEVEPQLGDIRFSQVLRVVDVPNDPTREVPVLALHRAGDPFEDFDAGDRLRLPIAYTHNPGLRSFVEQVKTHLADVVPLPAHSEELWEVLTEDLNAALLRYFPAPPFAEGTLGELLASGGGWTRGCKGASGDIEIEIESAFFDYYCTRPAQCDYGFVAVVRQGGVEVYRNNRAESHAPSGRLGEGKAAPYIGQLRKSDNYGNAKGWAVLPTSEASRGTFEEALTAIAAELASGQSLNGIVRVEELLRAAIAPPVRGGLWEWMATELPRVLALPPNAYEHTVVHDGVQVQFRIEEVHAPAIGLAQFGTATVGVTALLNGVDSGLRDYIQLGAVGPNALTLRGPVDDAERTDLARIVQTFRDWLDVHLDHHVARRGLEWISGDSYFYAFDGYFPLVQLLEQRILWGSPGSTPVPPFDDQALDRAARLVRKGEVDGHAHVIAAFDVEGWTIRLRDDIKDRPFGSYCGIDLIPPDSSEQVTVMTGDAWNPQARAVVDGDAFAFRRFATWLRAAIVRGGLDAVLSYEGGDDEDEVSAGTDLAVSDWLLFGMPDAGDRFLVDWRAQWDIVNAVAKVEDFAGIYGFSGEHVEKLRTRDIPLWRRFLHEVIDPRFPLDRAERVGDSAPAGESIPR